MNGVARQGLLVLAGLLAAGCASGPKLVQVSGRVTLDGGPVPGPGFIYFNPSGSGPQLGPTRPGTAEFDADGNYEAMTFQPGDGLLPGSYVLRVECWKTPPNMQGKPVVSHLPVRYQDASKSGLQLTVEPDARSMTYDINLSSR